MKHLPKSTLTEILNDPYGFTYKEMSEVIGEDKARALYAELYKQPFHKKNLSISTKKSIKVAILKSMFMNWKTTGISKRFLLNGEMVGLFA